MLRDEFFEIETLPVLLNAASSRLGLSSDTVQKISSGLSDQEAKRLNDQLVDLLKSLPPSAIEFDEELPPPGADPSKLSFRIWRQSKTSRQPQKMLFIRVKDAAPTVGINIVGFALALATLSPSAITSGMSAIKGVYDNFIQLKSPEDDDAMNVYDSLLRWTSAQIANGQQNPTVGMKVADLAQPGGPDADRAAKALKRLKELGLAEVSAWGGPAGDLTHADNGWQIRA